MINNKNKLTTTINTIKDEIENILSDKHYLQEKIKYKLSGNFGIHDIPDNLANIIKKKFDLDKIHKKEVSYDISARLNNILNDSTNEEFLAKYIEKDDIHKLTVTTIENLEKDKFNFNEKKDNTINFALNNLVNVLINILYENYYLIYTKADIGLTTNINNKSISEFNQHLEKNKIYTTETISNKPIGLNKLLESRTHNIFETKLKYDDNKNENDKSYKFNKISKYQYKVIQEINNKDKVYTYNTIYPIIEDSESNFSLNRKLYLREFTDTKIAINFDLPINEIISHIELIKKDYDNGKGIKSISEILDGSTNESNLLKFSKNKSWADKLYIFDYIQKRNLTKNDEENDEEKDKKSSKRLKFQEVTLISELAELLNNNKKPTDNSIFKQVIKGKEDYNEKEKDDIKEKLDKLSDATRKHYEDISKQIRNATYKQIIRGKNNLTPIINNNFYDFILEKLKENLTNNK
ncbi:MULTISPECIES: hypothetical protein [Aliarcobacter]|uniref:hypothetical protein n=1 Tax=Aliarcobacter TaxID=2321111 RepID=UPI00112F1315|nr:MULTISPECIES: hypothetical protein [Aliarcobacter]